MAIIFVMFIVISCIQVAEKLSKYCVLLHLLEGSTDVAHFSAICILGLNDVFPYMKTALFNYTIFHEISVMGYPLWQFGTVQIPHI